MKKAALKAALLSEFAVAQAAIATRVSSRKRPTPE